MSKLIYEAELDSMIDDFENTPQDPMLHMALTFFDDMKNMVGKHGITKYLGFTGQGAGYANANEDEIIKNLNDKHFGFVQYIAFRFKLGEQDLTLQVVFSKENGKPKIYFKGGVLTERKGANTFYWQIAPNTTEGKKLTTPDRIVAYALVGARHSKERDELSRKHEAERKAVIATPRKSKTK